jgi:hypothetical protein
MHAMDEALHQLRVVRVAASIATRKFYRCQRSYIRSAKDPVGCHSAGAMQVLDEYLKAAEAHEGALNDLWDVLFNAAPFPGREEEMRRTMARYEIVVSELHAIRMLVLGL